MSWSKPPVGVLVCIGAVFATAPVTAGDLNGAAPTSSQPAAGKAAFSHTSAQPASPASKTSKNKLYQAALERYAAGDLEGALQYLLRCYEETHSSNLLYSLAQLHAEMNHCAVALDYYQRFLSLASPGKERQRAELQVDKLRKQCADPVASTPPVVAAVPPVPSEPAPAVMPASTATAAPVPVAAPPSTAKPPEKSAESQSHPPTTDASRHSRTLATVGWVALGTGVALTGASVYFGVKAHQAKDDFDARKRLVSVVPWGQLDLEEPYNDFFRNRNLAVGFGIAAGTVTATGIFLVLFGSARGKTAVNGLSSPIALSLTPDGGFASIQSAF